ncbi:MAG: division plane positioning ATPase MipZ, partial [Pseudomonadota bacterium]
MYGHDASSEVVEERRLGRVIVVGNEKGGAGKSTVAMHVSVALMR